MHAHCLPQTPRRPGRQLPGRRVAMIVPPLFRLLGSENRRMPPGATLDAGILNDAGYEVTLVHGDAGCGPHQRHLSWQELYRGSRDSLRIEFLCARLEEVWPELRDRLARVRPDVVFVLSNDWVESAKDLADPFVSIELGKLLCASEIPRVVAVGGLPTRFPKYFAQEYPVVICGPPGHALIEAIQAPLGWHGILHGEGGAAYTQVRPQVHGADVSLDRSQVACDFGCQWGTCEFCPIAQMFGQGIIPRSADLVADDVHARSENRINIIDTCFGWNIARLRDLTERLKGLDKTYVVSSRLEIAARREVMDRFHEMHVETIKVGVESLSDRMLRAMRKGQTVKHVIDGLHALHQDGFKLFGYLLLGSSGETPDTLAETLSLARTLDFIVWLPNIFCPLDDRAPEAHHFSFLQARKLNLPDDLVSEFFQL